MTRALAAYESAISFYVHKTSSIPSLNTISMTQNNM